MTQKTRRLIAVAIMVAAGTMVSAQETTSPVLTGKWMLKMESSPHGPAEMPLMITQDGTKVTAILSPPGHGADFELKGEFVKGQLSVSIPASDTNMAITIKATLKPDGTLVGFTSSDMGDTKWVGTRVKQ